MSRFVVDASVAVKWVVTEENSPAALRFLEAGHAMAVPDLFFAEVASVFQKKCRRGEMIIEDAETALRCMLAIPLEAHAAQNLAEDALRLSSRCGASVYDGIYLALAERQRCPLITADERLARQVSATNFSEEVRVLQQAEG